MAEAELPTIARPYARAAFSSGLDQTRWSWDLVPDAQPSGCGSSEPSVEEALDNPTLTTEDETSLVLQLTG